MFRNILSLRAFIQQQQGAIAIELAFVLMLMIAILGFMADSLVKQAFRGKLDRTVYSLTSILRERGKFFDKREEITQADLERLNAVAKAMLPDGSTFILQITFVAFTASKAIDWQKSLTLQRKNQTSTASGNFTCTLPNRSDELRELSPKSAERWVPLYRVTLCVPVNTGIPDLWNLFGPSETSAMQSSAIMLSRKSG